MALIDIIIPVFNNLKFTQACLASLYRYTESKDFHLIMIENASKDKTKEYLKDYETKVNNMDVLFSNKNLGWCKGINKAYKHLSKDGQYVVWANNDILFEYDWLNRMLKHFKAGVGAVGPTSNYVAGRQQVIFNHGHYEEEAPALIGFCLMFKREVVNLVGDIDERFGVGGSEEFDYILRMKKDLGFRCVIARDVYIHHFGSKTLWDSPEIGGTKEGYNKYHVDKDNQLREKWSNEIVDSYLGYSAFEVVIGVIHPATINWKFWVDYEHLHKPYGTHLVNAPKPALVYDMRNTIVEKAKELGVKKLFFLDADMRFGPDDLFKLLSIKAPIISGYFASRNKPYFPCFFEKVEDGKCKPIYAPHSGVMEGDAVGSAFTLYDMRLFDEIPHPWFYPGKYGEDIDFCLKARAKGYKVFCDTDLIIRHLGDEKEVSPEDYEIKEEGVS